MRIDNSIGINDYMTGTLRSIIRTMNMMISNMRALDQRARVLGSGAFNAMNNEIRMAEINLQRMEDELAAIGRAQQRNATGASSWALKLTGVFSAISMIRMAFNALSRFATFADTFTSANARLGLINDGFQTQVQLQDTIAKSARDTRASYAATADLVAKIGMTGALKSTQAAVDLAEKVNKLLVIGGGGAQQNEAALLQFSQSLSSGVMQGDEFRSLRENAPALMSTIAQGMGVPMGALKQLSTEGKLTTDTIIKALENMGASIDDQFAAMPVTFGQNMQMIKDVFGRWATEMAEGGALKTINDLFSRFNEWLSSDEGQEFLDGLADGLHAAAYAISLVVDAFVYAGDIIDSLGPAGDALLYGILVSGAVMAAQALWGVVAPLAAIAAAFLAANWPILLIGAAIGGVIVWLNRLGFTADDILSGIGGLAGGLAAFVVNKVIFLYNTLNLFAVFLQNLFIDPVYAVQMLFYNMVENVLGFLNGLVNGIIDGINWIANKANDVLGTDFGNLNHWDAKNPLEKPTSDKDIIEYVPVDYLDYNEMAQKGAGIAKGFANTLSGLNPFDTGVGAGSYDVNQVGDVEKVGKIDSDINIADEDIKMLLDAVTQKYVNQINLIVEAPAPIIQNSGTVREEADIQRVATELAEQLMEARTVSAELV